MVVDQWAPGKIVRLLPGATGARLAKIEIGILFALFPLLAILVAGMAITEDGYASSPFLVMVVVLIAGDVVLSSVVSARCNRKFRAEAKAGYTTSARRFNDVDQVDVQTGHVIRIAGERPLTRNQYAERVDRIRAHIQDASTKAPD
jgi:hypothetical protein